MMTHELVLLTKVHDFSQKSVLTDKKTRVRQKDFPFFDTPSVRTNMPDYNPKAAFTLST